MVRDPCRPRKKSTQEFNVQFLFTTLPPPEPITIAAVEGGPSLRELAPELSPASVMVIDPLTFVVFLLPFGVELIHAGEALSCRYRTVITSVEQAESLISATLACLERL
jgi:hypothetical protein